MGVDLAIACVMDPQCTSVVVTRRLADSSILLRHSIRFFPRRILGVSHPRRMTHLFSVNDALDVAKAVLLSEFFTYLALFSLTRLDGIPRSTPLIHALLLTAGLLGARAFVRIGSFRSRSGTHRSN